MALFNYFNKREPKYVYDFSEGNKDMRDILGGKGANLAEMTKLGLPVPQGFTVSTEACNKYYDNGTELGEKIEEEIEEHIHKLEQITGKKFGDIDNPLLVSVRSGARASMPGMMDTVLNLGLNDEVASNFSKKTDNPRFIYDSYRRFIMMFADVVKGYDKSKFERLLDKYKEKHNKESDLDLSSYDMMEVTNLFKDKYKEISGEDFPSDPKTQLIEAIKAVFRSWMNDRAIVYRKMNNIPSSWGTAVNVQEMVYGNLGETSGTGVAFTRNPSTGENKLFGEYLINAQGEDVVAGVRTPQSIETLKGIMPEVYEEFVNVTKKLEEHYKDMQDMEFTIENGKLFMLQTRNGKRTGTAAVKIAMDLIREGICTKEEALLKVDASSIDQLLHPTFDEKELKKAKIVTNGLAASPGAGSGKIYFNAEDIMEHAKNKENVILVRLETSPEDIEGMNSAKGVITIRGGMTSHAAVVARGMGKPCVSGCGNLIINEEKKTLTTADGTVYKEGDYLSVDGSTGTVYEGEIKTEEASISGDFKEFMEIVDNTRKLHVRVNADTPKDAKVGFEMGAEGIGLCRTEHMFFEEDRIFIMRQMITAPTTEKRKEALDKLLPIQRGDFEGLFRAAKGTPVIIRYLDPPLHEFLPKEEKDIKDLAKALDISIKELKDIISSLKEFNPMMGHRGCRLDITYPEIAVMQTRAVLEAAYNVKAEGIEVNPEIMIPLVCDLKELKFVKEIVEAEATKISEEKGMEMVYKIGTMIEIPRACTIAGDLAKETEFFSFGTNDLTQMTFGFSRDDAGKFLKDYYSKNVFDADPFKSIDETGVGCLMKMAVNAGRENNKNIELGICGEHGGDPKSVTFCHNLGLNYVSCSPYRVPIARLAAAQAAIKEKRS